MTDKWLQWRTRRRVKGEAVAVPAQELYQSLVKERISPGLRALGFKGSSGRYELAGYPPFALLGLQKSAYSDAAEAQFTANLLVVGELTWQKLRAERPHLPERPAPGVGCGTGVPQSRIGTLTESGDDKWWRVTSPDLLDQVAEDFLADIEAFGLPWMQARLGESQS